MVGSKRDQSHKPPPEEPLPTVVRLEQRQLEELTKRVVPLRTTFAEAIEWQVKRSAGEIETSSETGNSELAHLKAAVDLLTNLVTKTETKLDQSASAADGSEVSSEDTPGASPKAQD